MLSQRIVKFLKSYVVLSLDAGKYEKVLNLLRRKGIIIWDVERTETGITFKISRSDYNDYLDLFNELNIVPIKKIGASYKLKKLYVRLGFIIGALLIFIYLGVYSSFAWEIKVIGNENIKEENIISALHDKGVKSPILLSKIDKRKVEYILYKKFDNLKFVEAYIEGVKLIVFVKEKREIPYEEIDKNPSSIVSTKKAVIQSAIVKQGKLMVQQGDVVEKGQLLVQGTKKDKDNNDILVNSNATIMGYTYYTFEYKEPKVHTTYKETGNKNKVKYLVVGDKKIKLWGDKDKFKYKSDKNKKISIPLISDFLNISFENVTQYELKKEDDIVTEAYAKNKLKIEVFENLINMSSKNSKLYKDEYTISENDNEYILYARIQLIEDIGEHIKIYELELPQGDNIEQNTQ